EKVPRHLFVPEAFRELSYRDRPLPIGHGQTISQPFVVARMSEVADVQPHETCLEVGTGSGYQAAVLAELCKKVYSIEYLPEVAKLGAEQLRGAGYGAERVALRVGDGYGGWAEAAPFDAILVTAAPEQVPAPLLEQLAVGGKLVIPVGPTDGEQVLERWTRTRPGAEPSAFVRERLMGVRFVPFLGDRAERQGRWPDGSQAIGPRVGSRSTFPARHDPGPLDARDPVRGWRAADRRRCSPAAPAA